MKILLFGKDGQVGWELQRSLALLGPVVALGRAGRDGLVGDLQDIEGACATVRSLRPDAIVNAAAYTAVDKAESEPDVARVINTAAPTALAREAAALGSWLVHYSTDYVFDGSGTTPWTEDDATGPLGVYGATKLAGEQGIQAAGGKHLVFRTSWVYAARGNNFAKTMLRLAKERDELSVVVDQVGAPTGAEALADATAHALRVARQDAGVSGTYHLAASGETNWLEYARFVIDRARAQGAAVRVPADSVRGIATRDYPTPARRPLNSRLATHKFTSTFDLCLPPWREGVARVLDEGNT
ncbi:MAG: dTDP-4-dehydrorhamnose reductase [Sandaracinaceae bacterium]|nr:dTDP-4-dehydrorhamnose reductase [Sandaracinaceae bacterium]